MLAILLKNIVLTLVPRVSTAPMMTIDRNPAIMAYSIAVAPRSQATNALR
jgi:hypothetical protein